MAAQAIDFFIDIEALRQDRDFLLDAVLVDVFDQRGDAIQQLGAHAGADLRQTFRHAGGELQQTGAALLQSIAQPRALAVAGAREFGQCFGQ